LSSTIAWLSMGMSAHDGAMHRHSGLKVSVVYRVPDDLNDLNGLNCLNAQRSLPSGLDEGLVSRDRRGPRKDRDRTEDPKVVSGSHQAKYLSQDVTLAAPIIGSRR
jgi:hypothetical protein